MNETNFPVIQMDQAVRYRIWIQGTISERWRDWFETTEVESAADEVTCLTSILPDQAGLLGLLQKLYSFGYPILKVEICDT